MKHSIYIFIGMSFAPFAEFDNREVAEASFAWMLQNAGIPLPAELFHIGPSPFEFKKNGQLRPLGCHLPAIA